MPQRPNESHFEEVTIERLKLLGYAHQDGGELRGRADFPLEAVVLTDKLRAHLRARYSHLPEDALDAAVAIAVNPEGVSSLQRNMSFHKKLTRGFEVPYKISGEKKIEHVYVINWDEPDKNDFLVVSQLPIHGNNDRRPDLIIYVNGFPLVVFELKSPYDEYVDVDGAYNQIQHYAVDIPQLFDFNSFCVASDGIATLHGMHSAELNWFSPWKSIDGKTTEPLTTGSMKTLIEGLFPIDRLLQYIRHFIVFESVNDVITKKGAKYHQFFGVQFAVQEALRATQPDGDRRIGVIWHTQGSGKSLSMIFFAGILQKKLENPTFVIQVDRNDLDEQLYDFFIAAKQLVGEVKHAETVEELRSHVQTEGGGVIFTTIEKFRLREEEMRHPALSPRRNIIVIADEAHRTQYGLMKGFAYQLRQALPNASFIGFTGTPVDLADRDTQSVFGNIIHTYDIPQAQEDKAIVPIYYEARLVKLHLLNEKINEELEEIMEGEETEAERLKAKWAAIEAAAGTKERLSEIAQDILTHFEERTKTLFGKAIIVCMSRRICVALYEEIIKLRPGWHDKETSKGKIKIVMTGNLSEDPKAWNEAGHITTKNRREQIKDRLKDPDDPLQIVLVRDMWLTGTDIPCLHTLYVDKPMKGHNLMQAIARVNRVFRDKPGGLVVDFIGFGHLLKEAARKFTADGFGKPVEDLDETAKEIFFQELEEIRKLLPDGITVSHWRSLSKIEHEDLCMHLFGFFIETDEKRDTFLSAEKRLSSAYSLVKHLPDCMKRADEVAFYQLVRSELKKTLPGKRTAADREQAVRDLIDRSITSEGVVDIFKAAGIQKPDISIIDEKFLEEFKSKEQENLRLKLLEKLLGDEIQLRKRKNLKKYRSFKDMLEKTLKRYHNNAITAAEVIKTMLKLRDEMQSDDRRKTDIGLDNEEELAFYDAVAELKNEAYDVPFLCDLVRDVVKAVRNSLKVDWTKPHREDVKSEVRVAVKNVLRRKNIRAEQFDFILNRVMEQAAALYEEWPLVA